MFKSHRSYLAICVALLGSLALSGCLEQLNPFSQHPNYQIEGIENDKDIKGYLDKILKERVSEDIDYDEESAEFERAETAREELITADLVKAMKAKGYYDAEVTYEDDAAQPLKGSYTVKAGSVYTIETITITPESAAENFDSDLLQAGQNLEAEAVLEAQSKLYQSIQKDECYFSLDVSHRVLLDKQNKTADLMFNVDIGPKATFGAAVFEGHESVDDEYLHKIVKWKEGDCFRQEKIRATKTALLETGLFVRAESTLPEAPDENGKVPVTLQLKERVHRSLKAGLSYYTDEGAGITLGWEHRNFLGAGEHLETELKVNQITQSLNADFTKPFFLRKDQSLSINSALRTQDTDAFEESAFEIGSSIKRKFNKRLSVNGGVQFSFSEITDETGRETYGLLSFPFGVSYDSRDNTLDPHKGWYLTGGIEPFYDMLGESDPFNKLEAGARTYIDMADDPDLVLALRANAGSLLGSDTAEIPATERFYAGGGGSVRGYGYQQVGPFENGNPSGGRSYVTSSVEARIKFTETIGGVAFVDAGSVSESTAPDLDNLAIGTGVGLRYYTGFGPLRFDVAVPLTQKDDLDQNYQFYISIGQAF